MSDVVIFCHPKPSRWGLLNSNVERWGSEGLLPLSYAGEHLKTKTLLVSALAVVGSQAIAQELIHLHCVGELEQMTDGAKKPLPASIDLTIDLKEETAVIEGNWGCTLNIGGSPAGMAKSQCRGKQPVAVTDNEVSFYAKSLNPSYEVIATFAVDRFSSNLKVANVMGARSTANASWTTALISGEIPCTRLKKSF